MPQRLAGLCGVFCFRTKHSAFESDFLTLLSLDLRFNFDHFVADYVDRQSGTTVHHSSWPRRLAFVTSE